MFGWNPETGEPWLAIRLRLDNAYPALSGYKNKRLREFVDMLNEGLFIV